MRHIVRGGRRRRKSHGVGEEKEKEVKRAGEGSRRRGQKGAEGGRRGQKRAEGGSSSGI